MLTAVSHHLPTGSVDFLEQPTMAFVRLQEAVELESVLEVPVPVRFLFVLLGPPTTSMDYHQIGRSISTLMSDKVSEVPISTEKSSAKSRAKQSSRSSRSLMLIWEKSVNVTVQQFHEAAYLADDRQDLLNAINSFLDCSIVLPPSEMGDDELLRSVARFQREMLRKREEQEVKLLAKEAKSPKEKGERLYKHLTPVVT